MPIGVLFFFKLEDHQPKLYGFMTYLEVATETKRLERSIQDWASFRARSLRVPTAYAYDIVAIKPLQTFGR